MLEAKTRRKISVMEFFVFRCSFAFSLSCWLLFFSPVHSAAGQHGEAKVRGVNLGGWLVLEGWIKPSLFHDIPNGDMLDGTMVQLKSAMLQKYVSAANGGGMGVTVDRDSAREWETFKLWRVSKTEFQFRTYQGQFLTCSDDKSPVSATSKSPSATETFYIERSSNNNRIHIRTGNDTHLQVTADNQLKAVYARDLDWGDNASTFELIIFQNALQGDYQFANGHGRHEAERILKAHRDGFITKDDFRFLSQHGINAVRIPVGWWIAYDSDPPYPFIGGSLKALDDAFSWAQTYDIRCIVDLHAAPGSQNGMEHSASRDGSTGWPNSSDYISQTLRVIDFLASRYAKHSALLGIELLNEPSAATVPADILIDYYKRGYETVRKYSPNAYVIMCQRVGDADPMELYTANIGSNNLVLDLHYYNLFDSTFNNLSIADNIQFIYKRREAQLQKFNNASAPLIFIGEWVDEWNVTSGNPTDYQDFGKAQIEVYDAASFGWAYWTLKNDEKHWDLEWNIRNNYLQLGNSAVLKTKAALGAMLVGLAFARHNLFQLL